MEESREIPRIGPCQGCLRTSALKRGACKECASVFGPKYGEMAGRIRKDPEFRRKCYEALSSDLARRVFREKFGSPHTAMGPASMAEGVR